MSSATATSSHPPASLPARGRPAPCAGERGERTKRLSETAVFIRIPYQTTRLGIAFGGGTRRAVPRLAPPRPHAPPGSLISHEATHNAIAASGSD